jgi:hypothetical protein
MSFDIFLDPFTEIRKLKSDIQELQKWRDQIADPNIQSNVDNIIKIDTNLTQNVVPAIQQAQKDIQTDKLLIQENVTKVDNMVDLVNVQAGEVTAMRDQVSKFAADINTAKADAFNALNQVKDMSNRFIVAADGVVADMAMLKQASDTFVTVLTREASAISAQFGQFADGIVVKAEIIKAAAAKLGVEFNEMITEMGKPIINRFFYYGKFYTNICWSSRKSSIKYILFYSCKWNINRRDD